MKWQNCYNKLLLSKITNYYSIDYNANYYQLCDNEKNSLLTAIAIIMLMEISNHKDNYILLVEDEKDILDLFTEYLSSSGFNTISFQNPI